MTINLGSDKKKVYTIFWICLAVAAVGLYLLGTGKSGGSRRAIPGGTPAPIQTETEGQTEIDIPGWQVDIHYLYEYEMDALVIHTHNYPGFDLGNKLVPKDVAFAWGSVAEYNDRIDFNWSQMGRWYSWHTRSYDELAPVGGESGVNTQSANCHLIAADSNVKKTIRKLKAGNRVKLKGYLVNVDACKPNGSTFTWNSSTTREDTGDGACEVIYVTDIKVVY